MSAPNITSGRLSSFEDLGTVLKPSELSQFSLIQFHLPAKLSKKTTSAKKQQILSGGVNSTDIGEIKFNTTKLKKAI